MSDIFKKSLNHKLPPRMPVTATVPMESKSHGSKSALQRNKRDYTVIPWTNYFDTCSDIVTENNNRFRVYIKGDSGPVFFFLHGGGFSGLSWSLLSSRLVSKLQCRCYSIDIRGHGDTVTDNDEDLSIEKMSLDIKQVVESIWKDDCPPIILVGHSMGGALAVHTANSNYIKNLVALVVIDVVEGSAMEALSSMQTFLQGRPKVFNTVEQAVEYNVRSGSIRNVESARVSIIGQLRKVVNKESENTVENADNILKNIGMQSHAVMQTEIAEEDEESAEQVSNEQKKDQNTNETSTNDFKLPEFEKYEWRIDLSKTEKFWKTWFNGLSHMFLNVHAPKLLLLAGVDRLDKELMIGQMQGKFQMQVLPFCGHAVHEDSPDDVADALCNFVLRYKFAEQLDEINPPKLCC